MLRKFTHETKIRYGLQIMFVGQEGKPIRFWDWNEYFETLAEIEPYKALIDKTVAKAQIVDWQKEIVIERLK